MPFGWTCALYQEVGSHAPCEREVLRKMKFTRSAPRSFALFLAAAAAVSSAAQATPDEILQRVSFRNIGPAVMSGRIADLDVDPKNLAVIYIATASGGVWKTTSGGIEFEPIFDAQSSASIGDVTVSLADSNVIWVGTGESNSRNSSGWGDGVYKSTDAGKTWTNTGLKETQQIGRIITHPKDVNTIWVAAIGPLWNPSEHRGVYKTTDGGATWSKVLYTDANTGAIDLVQDPRNPNVLYAGMWERMRHPWTFRSGGPNGGVFKTTDGGKTWSKLGGGLPTGLTGRIGLTIYPKNPNILYAIVEAERASEGKPDQNGIYRTEDAGKTWKRMGTHGTRPFYYHEILVDPNDDSRIYSASTNVMLSTDKGATWRVMPIRMHVDYHALWVNPNNSDHLIFGQDGGFGISWDKGVTWKHASNLPASQFYAIGVDMATPYWVYGGLQDNGSWGAPTVSRMRQGIGNWEWIRVGGGDGFHCQADPEDNETVYSESQGGNITRLNKRTGESRFIKPRAPQGETYRFNWSSPIVLSPHNAKTVWFGGNKLFKSVNRGDDWAVVSPDLTTNNPEKLRPMGGLTPERTGAELHCTIITISESPRKAGVVWVGTDDGLVQVSLNDGHEWKNVSEAVAAAGVPQNTWCSRVLASRYKLERCYATFDGHRTGDMRAYVLMSDDFGATWKNISSGLPPEATYVIKEDPNSEDTLYVGTEMGLYVSFDRGTSWTRWRANLPSVAVHDIVIHERDKEILLGTHGRGIWIAPLEGISMLTTETRAKTVLLADPVTAFQWVTSSSGGYGDGQGHFFGTNPPSGARISYYIGSEAANLKIEILSADGAVIATIPNPPTTRGVHTVYWNMRQSGEGRRPSFVSPGTYGVRVSAGTEVITKTLTVRPDPAL